MIDLLTEKPLFRRSVLIMINSKIFFINILILISNLSMSKFFFSDLLDIVRYCRFARKSFF